MGLFDNLAGGLKNIISNPQGQNDLLQSIGSLVTNPETGGLSGLIQTFKDKGLNEVVSSWVGTGKNLPVSADQIASVLNKPQIQKIATQLGVSPENASQQIAEYLPKIIDKLTPNGSVPASGDVVSKGLEMLKGKIFGS